MRPIKFRGLRAKTKKPIYGDGIFKYPGTTETYIGRSWVRPPIGAPVEENSVEYLIATDAADCDIYEGDLVKTGSSIHAATYMDLDDIIHGKCLLFEGTTPHLIGVDANKNEIYEGDNVVRDGDEYKASFADRVGIITGAIKKCGTK